MNKQVENILKKHGLDFRIEKLPLVAHFEKEQLITPYYGLFNMKTKECINTCKGGYTVSQNVDILELILEGIKSFGSKLTVVKAGSINGGRRVYIQLEIEGTSKVNGDVIKRYITIIDSNDGSTGLSIGIGDLTMSCENQFFLFYKKGDHKFRHTATLEEKILTIPTLIDTALAKSLEQIKIYQKFASTPLTKGLADKLVMEVLGYDTLDYEAGKEAKAIGSLVSHIHKEIRGKGNNLWGLHSGVTSWTTHEKKGPKRANGFEESMLVGTGYNKNLLSFNFAKKHAGLILA